MQVDEREREPQEGEILQCYDGLKYTITKHHGTGPHTLLGCLLHDPHYDVRYEDGIESRVTLCQMYSDTYIQENLATPS